MAGNPFLRLIWILGLIIAGVLVGLFFPASVSLYPVIGMLILAIALNFAPKGMPTLVLALTLVFIGSYLLGTVFSGAL